MGFATFDESRPLLTAQGFGDTTGTADYDIMQSLSKSPWRLDYFFLGSDHTAPIACNVAINYQPESSPSVTYFAKVNIPAGAGQGDAPMANALDLVFGVGFPGMVFDGDTRLAIQFPDGIPTGAFVLVFAQGGEL